MTANPDRSFMPRGIISIPMRFLDRLFRKPSPASPAVASPPPVTEPIALRDQLFAAANRGGGETFASLCTINRAAIADHFPSWTNLKAYPNVNVKDRQQVQYIMNGLGMTAQFFRDQLGDSSLWDRVVGPPEDNPFTRFERTLARARDLSAKGRFDEAADVVTGHLIDTKSLAGTAMENFRALSHGLIGICRFQTRRTADAIDHFQQALNLCSGLNDREGVGVYLGHLYESHRYLGEAVEAAAYAERLSEHHTGTPESARWYKQAALVRAGEPLVRMVVQLNGEPAKFEIDEVAKPNNAQMTFLFERNRVALAPSHALTTEGEKLGSAGKYDEALALFRDAATADPFDPQPHYEAGITLLLLQRYAQAIEEYEQTIRLAPGWFNVQSDLWIAQELLAGRLAHEIFLVTWAAENAALPPAQKLSLIDQGIARQPALPHLHFWRAVTLLALDRKTDAADTLRAGLELQPEPDIRSRMLAQLAAQEADPSAQRRLFQQILDQTDANLMSRSMARACLNDRAVEGSS
jgi:tetratricopeptide (TPR) repeat protein